MILILITATTQLPQEMFTSEISSYLPKHEIVTTLYSTNKFFKNFVNQDPDLTVRRNLLINVCKNLPSYIKLKQIKQNQIFKKEKEESLEEFKKFLTKFTEFIVNQSSSNNEVEPDKIMRFLKCALDMYLNHGDYYAYLRICVPFFLKEHLGDILKAINISNFNYSFATYFAKGVIDNCETCDKNKDNSNPSEEKKQIIQEYIKKHKLKKNDNRILLKAFIEGDLIL